MYFYYKIKDNKFNGFDVTNKKKSTLENGEFELTEEEYFELQGGLVVYKDGILKKICVPVSQYMAKPVFDFETLENKETATPIEKQDFFKNKMIEVNNQIKELNEIGLGGGAEEASLRIEFEKYKKLYMDAVHQEANQINESTPVVKTKTKRAR